MCEGAWESFHSKLCSHYILLCQGNGVLLYALDRMPQVTSFQLMRIQYELCSILVSVQSLHGFQSHKGPQPSNDVNAQCINVAGSMKLGNAALRVVGHYFCCTIP